jgi:hypothetical protein
MGFRYVLDAAGPSLSPLLHLRHRIWAGAREAELDVLKLNLA